MQELERSKQGKCPAGFHLRGVSIEACTACNQRCTYCPVSTNPYPQKVMELTLFCKAIKEVDDLGVHIRRISMNHYNEPFLDPLLIHRIQVAITYVFFDVVLLNTNLSILPAVTMKKLVPFRDRIEFNVNLPTTDKAAYHSLHGKDHLDRVMANLENVVSMGFRTRVNVQRSALSNTAKFDVAKLPDGVKVDFVQSNSRAGSVRALALGTRPHQKLRGCSIKRPTSNIHIGVDGTVFFCCEDYFKQYQIGTIKDRPLHEILGSEQMRRYLSYLNGESNAPQDFLCRSCELAIVGPPDPVRDHALLNK